MWGTNLWINYKNECTTAFKNAWKIKLAIENIHLTRKVPYCEGDKGIIWNVCQKQIFYSEKTRHLVGFFPQNSLNKAQQLFCGWERNCVLPSFTTLLVLSRNKVSLGDILWKTTFWIDDLPLLKNVNTAMCNYRNSMLAERKYLRRPIMIILGLVSGENILSVCWASCNSLRFSSPG